jgi:hypothetical protein
LTTALLSVILLTACGTTPSSSVTEVPQAVESVTATQTILTKVVLYATPTAILNKTPDKNTEIIPTIFPSVTTQPTILGTISWRLQDPFSDSVVFTNLTINKSWKFSYAEYYNDYHIEIDVFPCTDVLGYTQDQAFVYFALKRNCRKNNGNLANYTSLLRMNLENGKTTEVLQASSDGKTYSASLSPNTKFLVYAIENPMITFEYPTVGGLFLLNLRTGEKLSYLLEEDIYTAGNFHWSDTEQNLVFFFSKKGNPSLISIRFLDLEKEEATTTFVQDSPKGWEILGVDETGVKLIDPTGKNYFFNIKTSVLKITP